MTDTVTKDLGASLEEVIRQVGRLDPLYPRRSSFAADGAAMGMAWRAAFELGDGGEVTIELASGPERRIALLSIPTTRVTMRFDAASAAERARFVGDFQRVTQRGGG